MGEVGGVWEVWEEYGRSVKSVKSVGCGRIVRSVRCGRIVRSMEGMYMSLKRFFGSQLLWHNVPLVLAQQVGQASRGAGDC